MSVLFVLLSIFCLDEPFSLFLFLCILCVHSIVASYNCSVAFAMLRIWLLPKPQFIQFCTEAFIFCLSVWKKFISTAVSAISRCYRLFGSWWNCWVRVICISAENEQKRSVRFQWTEHYNWMSENQNGTYFLKSLKFHTAKLVTDLTWNHILAHLFIKNIWV